MQISDEAVEDAARAMAQFDEWGHVSDEKKAHLRRSAKRALEAAAPHMLADAWNEGEEAGQDNADSNRGYNIEHKTNPYRSQT